MKFKSVFKEPLLHFAVAGVSAFLLFEAIAPADAGLGEKDILVDRDALLTHIQYRTRTFEPQLAAKRLEAMTPEVLERTINDLVREEALHREALALGMDANDYIIKRRLIQKVEFLAEGLADASTQLSDEELDAYYQANRDDYFVEPQATLTHVFFSAEERGYEAAQQAAKQQLADLKGNNVEFADAIQYGDRFAFHRNYVERTPDLIASHLGEDIAKAVFADSIETGVWQGPYDSQYGSHLVLVTQSAPGHYPELDEVRQQVSADASNKLMRDHLEASIADIVDDYDVHIAYNANSAADQEGMQQ